MASVIICVVFVRHMFYLTELLTTLVRNNRVLRSCPDNETHRNNREGSKIYGWDYPCKSW